LPRALWQCLALPQTPTGHRPRRKRWRRTRSEARRAHTITDTIKAQIDAEAFDVLEREQREQALWIDAAQDRQTVNLELLHGFTSCFARLGGRKGGAVMATKGRPARRGARRPRWWQRGSKWVQPALDWLMFIR
jgi:hypothetical protein